MVGVIQRKLLLRSCKELVEKVKPLKISEEPLFRPGKPRDWEAESNLLRGFQDVYEEDVSYAQLSALCFNLESLLIQFQTELPFFTL
jgi:hypothetical protein